MKLLSPCNFKSLGLDEDVYISKYIIYRVNFIEANI